MREYSETVLEHLSYAQTAGLTYKELVELTDKDHGTVSGALSNLHRDGMVFAIHQKRKNCMVYVHSTYKKDFSPSERIDKPSKNKSALYLDALENIIAAYISKSGLDAAINEAIKIVKD